MRLIENKEEFDKVYAIMEESFPEDERRTYAEQRALLDESEYKIYAFTDGKQIRAFIAIWEFEKAIFVEHLAVSSEYRNAKLGSKILQKLMSESDKMICLEVELPNNEIAKRRIGFYERNGFYLNGYDYVQPPMSEGKSELPLSIMTSQRKIDESEFEYIRSMLYKKVYKRGIGSESIGIVG